MKYPKHVGFFRSFGILLRLTSTVLGRRGRTRRIILLPTEIGQSFSPITDLANVNGDVFIIRGRSQGERMPLQFRQCWALERDVLAGFDRNSLPNRRAHLKFQHVRRMKNDGRDSIGMAGAKQLHDPLDQVESEGSWVGKKKRRELFPLSAKLYNSDFDDITLTNLRSTSTRKAVRERTAEEDIPLFSPIR